MRLKVEKSLEGVSEKWIIEENGLYHLVAFFLKNVLDVEVNRAVAGTELYDQWFRSSYLERKIKTYLLALQIC